MTNRINTKRTKSEIIIIDYKYFFFTKQTKIKIKNTLNSINNDIKKSYKKQYFPFKKKEINKNIIYLFFKLLNEYEFILFYKNTYPNL